MLMRALFKLDSTLRHQPRSHARAPVVAGQQDDRMRSPLLALLLQQRVVGRQLVAFALQAACAAPRVIQLLSGFRQGVSVAPLQLR